MVFNPTLIWFIAGVVLCLTELIVPTAFVSLVMGVSAIVVACLSFWIPLSLQIGLWMVLSIVLLIGSRQFINPKAARTLDATEAATLTEILPGELGRVLYEGNSWAARGGEGCGTIAANQTVYIVGRKGTTLIVVPQDWGDQAH